MSKKVKEKNIKLILSKKMLTLPDENKTKFVKLDQGNFVKKNKKFFLLIHDTDDFVEKKL